MGSRPSSSHNGWEKVRVLLKSYLRGNSLDYYDYHLEPLGCVDHARSRYRRVLVSRF
jgi:hypothetical protein